MSENLELESDSAIELLSDRIQNMAAQDRRIVVGVAGGPGAGKSTFAKRLVGELNRRDAGSSACVPMDGFHTRHRELELKGLAKEKGAPHTFDSEAFVAFLEHVAVDGEAITGPVYSRKIEDVVDDGYVIDSDVKYLIVEGNYLLLDSKPWCRVRSILDLAVFLDVPREVVRKRLLRRHAVEGLFSAEHIREHVQRVDLANFRTINDTKSRADLIFRIQNQAGARM